MRENNWHHATINALRRLEVNKVDLRAKKRADARRSYLGAYLEAFDLRFEVWQPIERRLLLAPIIFVEPIADYALELVLVEAVGEIVFIGQLFVRNTSVF